MQCRNEEGVSPLLHLNLPGALLLELKKERKRGGIGSVGQPQIGWKFKDPVCDPQDDPESISWGTG